MKSLAGEPVAEQIYGRIKKGAAALKRAGLIPYLVVFQVGDLAASSFYIKRKKEACKSLGFKFEHIKCSKNISEAELIMLIDQKSKNKEVHGMILQLPLPGHLNQEEIVKHIDPSKDLDGLHPFNQGLLIQEGDNWDSLKAPAARAVIEILNFYGYNKLKSKRVVVIGASALFGLPLALYCTRAEATVTICQKSTHHLARHTKEAKFVLSAAGYPGLLKPNMVAKNVVIIDGGFSQDKQGKLVGDVSKRGDWHDAQAISPVPGGVGRVTVACLLENLVKATEAAKVLAGSGK